MKFRTGQDKIRDEFGSIIDDRLINDVVEVHRKANRIMGVNVTPR